MKLIIQPRLMHLVLLLAVPLTASSVRIIQTNSAGDDVDVINPATNKAVGVIHGIEVNHGAASAPDGKLLFISNEGESTLEVVNTKSLKVTKSIALSGHPNNIAINKDGRRVYVSIARAPGAVDVIDTASLEDVKSIPVKGAVHNSYVTPDGKFFVSGSIASKTITVTDQKTETPVWSLTLDLGIRPMAFATNPDGSTKWIFVQLSDFNGFEVMDFDTHKEIKRITNPPITAGKKPVHVGGNASHGMAVTADGKTLVVKKGENSELYAYSIPDLKVIGGADVGMAPDWVTLTPDGKTAYVADAGANAVSEVDIKSMKEVARIPVGEVPKRNITAVFP